MKMKDFCLNPDGAFFDTVEQNYNLRRAERDALAEQLEETLRQRAMARRRAFHGVLSAVSAIGLFALGALVASWI